MEQFEKTINYSFKDKQLLTTALTHSSYANEKRNQKVRSNERLEFLGDTVLSIAVSEYLYKNYCNLPEGELTRIRALIVCEESLCERARAIHIDKFLILGKGEEMTGGRGRISSLADCFEALLAAIYLDGGFDAAKAWILEQVKETIQNAVDGKIFRDYKTYLQELIQRQNSEKAEYIVIDEHGPDHDKYFTVELKIGNKVVGNGIGKSKKEAEQNAAKDALLTLEA